MIARIMRTRAWADLTAVVPLSCAGLLIPDAEDEAGLFLQKESSNETDGDSQSIRSSIY